MGTRRHERKKEQELKPEERTCMTETTALDLHQHLCRLRIIQLDVLQHEAGVDRPVHKCLRFEWHDCGESGTMILLEME